MTANCLMEYIQIFCRQPFNNSHLLINTLENIYPKDYYYRQYMAASKLQLLKIKNDDVLYQLTITCFLFVHVPTFI